MRRSLLVVLSLILFSTLNAGVMDGPGNPHLSNGDFIVGGKVALIGVYGANVGLILGGEYGLKEGFLSIPNFPTSLGIGGSIGYSSFSKNYPPDGPWSFTNFLITATGYYHVQLVKNQPIDTYALFNVGINITTDKYDGSFSNVRDRTSGEGGLKFGTGVGARYYFTKKLSAVGEIGFGMGVFRLGLDFKI